MEQDVIRRVLSKYGFKYETILEPRKGYRNTSYPVRLNDEEIINLIFYKNEPNILGRIKNANRTGDLLALKGLPSRKTYSKKILLLNGGKIMRYAGVYTYLAGETIPWEGYTMEHLKTLGHTMASMHEALETVGTIGYPSVVDESKDINKRMKLYFAEPGVVRALNKKLGIKIRRDDFTEILNATKSAPGRQVLHMDFVRGNILFENKKISGILDFEKTAYGSKLIDIARTLAFLLIDCKYKSEEKIRKYFLISGYIKRGSSSFSDTKFNDKSLLDELVIFFILHDLYKFLLYNPYEYLSSNQHYIRTRDYLLKVGIIAKV